jgi:hypothetical protein
VEVVWELAGGGNAEVGGEAGGWCVVKEGGREGYKGLWRRGRERGAGLGECVEVGSFLRFLWRRRR